MPRPPKSNHPLRQLRKILNVSQGDLAKIAGTSPATIKRAENGVAELSSRLQIAIGRYYGVMPGSLQSGNGPLDMWGNAYRKETLSVWRSWPANESYGDLIFSELIEHASMRLSVLLSAARKVNRFPEFYLRFIDFFIEIEGIDIHTAFRDELRSTTEEWFEYRLTGEELQKLPELLEVFGIPADPNISSAVPVIVEGCRFMETAFAEDMFDLSFLQWVYSLKTKFCGKTYEHQHAITFDEAFVISEQLKPFWHPNVKALERLQKRVEKTKTNSSEWLEWKAAYEAYNRSKQAPS